MKREMSQTPSTSPNHRNPGRFRICWDAVRHSLQRPSLLGSSSDPDHDQFYGQETSSDITPEDILHASSSYFSPGTTVRHNSFPFVQAAANTNINGTPNAAGSTSRKRGGTMFSEGYASGSGTNKLGRISTSRSRLKRPPLPRGDTSRSGDGEDPDCPTEKQYPPVSTIVVESDLAEWTQGRIEVPMEDGASIMSGRASKREKDSTTHTGGIGPKDIHLSAAAERLERYRAGRALMSACRGCRQYFDQSFADAQCELAYQKDVSDWDGLTFMYTC